MIDKKYITEQIYKKAFSLDKYIKIMEEINNVDISLDTGFQTLFNGFYRVRRNDKWRAHYYRLFQQFKQKNNISITFEHILRKMYIKTGKIEASFSSKMLASLNPDMPLWDKYVLDYLKLQLIGNTPGKRINNAIHMYDKIMAKYKENDLQYFISVFNEALPNYSKKISDTKKIDCFIWSLGGAFSSNS